MLFLSLLILFPFFKSNLCSVWIFGIIIMVVLTTGNRDTGWLTSILLHRMEVMLVKKNFNFKDLMSFGMFLLALLTFIYLICH